MKAAVLCSRLINNHPLPDGNKRVGFMCTVEFVERNGFRWNPPPGDDPGGEETAKIIEAVASGDAASQTWPSGSEIVWSRPVPTDPFRLARSTGGWPRSRSGSPCAISLVPAA